MDQRLSAGILEPIFEDIGLWATFQRLAAFSLIWSLAYDLNPKGCGLGRCGIRFGVQEFPCPVRVNTIHFGAEGADVRQPAAPWPESGAALSFTGSV
ncbi:hypothetical protein CBW56_17880 [Denitratisoma oestradiolicum]|nr:hypothetical protein CBW56_17880 [Denitratisoma oestradiolicum]